MSDENVPESSRDDTYFLQPIFFKVEGTIFQVPRHHFAANEVFSTTLTLPPGDGVDIEGSSEARPFELIGIAKKDFRAFLRVLYPLSAPPEDYDLTIEEWLSVLALSDLWDFQGLRHFAIRKISERDEELDNIIEPVRKIWLGEKYRVPAWFTDGCMDLIMRDKGPQVDEINELGLARAVSIYQLREKRLKRRCRRSDVKEMFGDVAAEATASRSPSPERWEW